MIGVRGMAAARGAAILPITGAAFKRSSGFMRLFLGIMSQAVLYRFGAGDFDHLPGCRMRRSAAPEPIRQGGVDVLFGNFNFSINPQMARENPVRKGRSSRSCQTSRQSWFLSR